MSEEADISSEIQKILQDISNGRVKSKKAIADAKKSLRRIHNLNDKALYRDYLPFLNDIISGLQNLGVDGLKGSDLIRSWRQTFKQITNQADGALRDDIEWFKKMGGGIDPLYDALITELATAQLMTNASGSGGGGRGGGGYSRGYSRGGSSGGSGYGSEMSEDVDIKGDWYYPAVGNAIEALLMSGTPSDRKLGAFLLEEAGVSSTWPDARQSIAQALRDSKAEREGLEEFDYNELENPPAYLDGQQIVLMENGQPGMLVQGGTEGEVVPIPSPSATQPWSAKMAEWGYNDGEYQTDENGVLLRDFYGNPIPVSAGSMFQSPEEAALRADPAASLAWAARQQLINETRADNESQIAELFDREALQADAVDLLNAIANPNLAPTITQHEFDQKYSGNDIELSPDEARQQLIDLGVDPASVGQLSRRIVRRKNAAQRQLEKQRAAESNKEEKPVKVKKVKDSDYDLDWANANIARAKIADGLTNVGAAAQDALRKVWSPSTSIPESPDYKPYERSEPTESILDHMVRVREGTGEILPSLATEPITAPGSGTIGGVPAAEIPSINNPNYPEYPMTELPGSPSTPKPPKKPPKKPPTVTVPGNVR